MERLNKIFGDGEMVQYREPVNPKLPPTETLMAIKKWAKMLQGCYNNWVLDNDGVIVWAGLLGKCKPEIMEGVIKEWMAQESKPPKPAELLGLYRGKLKQQSLSRNAGKILQGVAGDDPLYHCPYCFDTHYIAFQRNEPDLYGDTDYCLCSCDQKIGSLGAILTDPRYWWDSKNKRFSRKWAGDKGGEAR